MSEKCIYTSFSPIAMLCFLRRNTCSLLLVSLFLAVGILRLTGGGHSNAYAETFISSSSFAKSSTAVSVSSSSSSIQTSVVRGRAVLIQKSAEKSEVLPGGIINYSVQVTNVLLRTIRNATVTDQYDASRMTIVQPAGAEFAQRGKLVWTIPELEPGKTWNARYRLAVNDAVVHGDIVRNVVSITGPDVEDAVLSERVSAVQVNVIESLPAAGVPYDKILLIGIVSTSLLLGILQRKTRIVR